MPAGRKPKAERLARLRIAREIILSQPVFNGAQLHRAYHARPEACTKVTTTTALSDFMKVMREVSDCFEAEDVKHFLLLRHLTDFNDADIDQAVKLSKRLSELMGLDAETADKVTMDIKKSIVNFTNAHKAPAAIEPNAAQREVAALIKEKTDGEEN